MSEDDPWVDVTAHMLVSGGNDEKTNLRIEKEFETAAAEGLRPCTCHMDFFAVMRP